MSLCKKNIKLIDVTDKNIELIYDFLSRCKHSLKTFRYFSTRRVEEAINSHKATAVLSYDNMIVGYAHLDRDSEHLWLGICVADNYIGRGLGGLLMEEILLRNKPEEKVTLTVDKDNNSAINLYKKYGFTAIETSEKIIKMELFK